MGCACGGNCACNRAESSPLPADPRISPMDDGLHLPADSPALDLPRENAEIGGVDFKADSSPLPPDPRVSPLSEGLHTPSNTPTMAAEDWRTRLNVCRGCGFSDYDDEVVWRIDGMCRNCKSMSGAESFGAEPELVGGPCEICGEDLFRDYDDSMGDVCLSCYYEERSKKEDEGSEYDGWLLNFAESFAAEDDGSWQDENKVQECANLWREKEWANEDNDEEQTDYWGSLFSEKYEKLSASEQQECQDILGSMGAESFGAEGKCQSMETGKYGNHKWMGGPVKENSLTNDYETVYGNFGIYCDKCGQEAYVSFDMPAEEFIAMCQTPYSHEFKDFDLRGAESFGAESAFDRLEDEVADEYEEKGMSDKEAQKVGAAVAYKQGVKKYGKKIMSESARKGVSAKSLKRAEIGPHVPTRIGATTTQRGVVKTYDSIPAGDGHVVGQFTANMDYAPSGMYGAESITDGIAKGFGSVLGIISGLIISGFAMNAVSTLTSDDEN